MFSLLNFFNGPGDHIHHNKVVRNDRGNASDINRWGILNRSLLTTNRVLDILIGLIRNLIIEIADQVIWNLIIHGIEHIAIWPDLKDNDVDIAADYGDNDTCVVPVLEFWGGFLVGDQAAHVSHVKESETLDYRVLNVDGSVVWVVLVQVPAYLP